MDMKKVTVLQSVFESPAALRAAKRGHEAACLELANTPRHLLGEGNPNHPMYDLQLFGEHHESFIKRQYKADVQV